MSESDESIIPSGMNLADLLEMATSNNETEEESSSANKLGTTDANTIMPTSLAQTSTFTYDLKINYTESLAQRIGSL